MRFQEFCTKFSTTKEVQLVGSKRRRVVLNICYDLRVGIPAPRDDDRFSNL